MRDRLARPRRIVRGRLVAPIAAAAAVALVGGVVVATPDAPTVRQDVQTVATVIPGLQVDTEFSYDLDDLSWTGSMGGFKATAVSGLPDGLTFDGGVISGTPTKSGLFDVVVTGTAGGTIVEHTLQLVVADSEGNLPAGAQAGSSGAVQGSLGGEAEAGGQIVTGSEGADSLLDAVASIVVALGGNSDSVGELATGSAGGTDTPGGPLGSLTDTEGGPAGSTTEGEAAGGAELTTEGEITVPGSSVPGSTTTGTTGSLGNVAPGLALTGAALLGLAGLSIVLNGGSSTPGASSSVPALLGSSTGGTTTGGSTGSGPNGSSTNSPGGSAGSVAPTVAAGSPKKPQAPGPTVANGRG